MLTLGVPLRVCSGLVALVVLAACGTPPVLDTRIVNELPEPVSAVEARLGSIRAIVQASGIVVGQEGAELRVVAPAPARVLEVTREVGEPVAAGDLLVRFDLALAAFEVARLRTDLSQAQAQLESARTAHDRAREFAERGFVPRRDLEDAERDLFEAEMLLQRATTALEAAETAANRAMVFAPFSGLVAERLHNPGDLAQPFDAAPVMRVVNPERLEVVARVTQADSARVLPGASVLVTSPYRPEPVLLVVAGPPLLAQIDGQGLVPVRLTFTTPAALAVDTRVDLEIDAEEHRDVLVVPPETLLTNGEEVFLFVAVDDRAERRVVTVGLTDGLQAEITSGLVAGELVVTRGQDVIEDGMLLTVDVEEPAGP